MPKVDAPIVGGKVDTSDISGSATSIAMAVGGVGLAYLVLRYGAMVGDWATNAADGALGTSAGSSPGIVFDGAP